jgi:DNA repair exonuclease SbcCD nuclease subunit
MKIIHTADLHLNEKKPERWQAMKEIIGLATTRKVDLLLICGDLFDSSTDAEKMRAGLRDLLSGAVFNTVILPGNHDHRAYREGLHFGDKVSVITDSSKPLSFNGLQIWGLPHEVLSREKLEGRLLTLASKMNAAKQNILLYHGELLDAFFSRDDMGEEGDQRYMPLTLSSFGQLPLRYVLAGHFHSRYARWPLSGGGSFIYSGSPVAVTRRETGRRAVNMLEAEKEPVELLLNSYHYEELNIELDPHSATDPLALLEEKVSMLHPAAKALVTVSGLFDGESLGLTEENIHAGIRQVVGERLAGEPVEKYYDVRLVMEDDLYRKLAERLKGADLSPAERERALEMVIEAFREVKTCS